MADADIPIPGTLGKRIALLPSFFDQWAADHGYDITLAVSACQARVYADSRTQEVFDAWNAGARSVAVAITESTLETQPLRERIRKLASGA